MDLAVIAVTFGAIFVVELPDKTFIAALVLSTRYKPLAVWIGVGLAFGVQTLVAVTAGALATLLPDAVIKGVALAIFLIAIFFITGADSASIVMGMLSENGEEHPRRWLVVFWGVAMGAVAALLLWQGGLQALQTLVIIVAGPFMLVICAMCVSLMKALREEPYESTLPPRVRRAVVHAQRFDTMEHHTVALAGYGAEPEEVTSQGGDGTTVSPTEERG
jgi:choline-glycine betaine transporter